MKSFKHYINEVLTPAQARKVETWPKRTPMATTATDPFFGKGVEDKHEPLSDTQEKSSTHKAIEKHLGKTIAPEEYKTGKMTDTFGRQVRIGAVLGKTKAPAELSRGFENDATRQAKGESGLSVRTTRSATGIAGQTSGKQSWEEESCKNIKSGCNRHYLPAEVEHGTVVSYLHDKGGKELARATFQPFTNDAGHTMYQKNSYYGVRHSGFMKHNDETEAALSGEHKGGSPIYRIKSGVYNNAKPSTAIHPKSTASDIEKTQDSPTVSERVAVLGHPKLTSKHLDKALADPNYQVKKAALQHPNLTPEHITKIMNTPSNNEYDDDNAMLKSQVITHHNATAHHIDKALDDPDSRVRLMAMHNNNANATHISKALNDTDADVRRAAIRHPNANATHITEALKDAEPDVRSMAILNPKATTAHIDTALKDPSSGIRTSAMRNPKATPDHITQALQDSNLQVRLAAIKHPKATTAHVATALMDDKPTVKNAAIQHPSASSEQISHALDSNDEYHREDAVSNPNLTPEHIKKVLSNRNNDTHIKREAISHPNVSKENLEMAVNDENGLIRTLASAKLKKMNAGTFTPPATPREPNPHRVNQN
jgi:HEAT repeat protein